MEFTIETHYTPKALASMAKALRKTVRKKHSRRSHICGWIVTGIALLLVIGNFALDFRTLITSIAALMLILALIFEDRINGYIAGKRLLPGTEISASVFTDSGFTSATEIGKTEWKYDKIAVLAETPDFFVFIFSMNHAQVYDKKTLQGGSTDDFRRFIENAVGKPILSIR